MTAFPRMISRPQQGKLLAVFRAANLTDRTERLDRISDYIGRRITSTTELSHDEATLVIDWIQRGGPAA